MRRQGVDVIGLKQAVKLAEFKPALKMNPEILARSEANRLRVVRQVRYSASNENSIDLVLFLNREREVVDLSKVVLTRHKLKNLGKRTLPLSEGETPKLEPITEAGSGRVQEKEKVYLAEVIEKLNELFGAETTDQDQLVYVNQVIRGRMLESPKLVQQAANNTREQFATSPDLKAELQNAIIASYEAHTAMSTKALNSPAVLLGMLDVLLNHSHLWEELRSRAAS